MKCPICNDPVDLHDTDEEDPYENNDLFVMEDVYGELMTYAGVVRVYKCHSDHTFYMEPSEIL
jgi:hypothetical protein